jgi:predicted dehydrogenase
MNTATTKEDQGYAVERLTDHYLKPSDTVYTLNRHTSASGMSRDISLFIAQGGEIIDITFYAAHALGWRLVERNGRRAIRVSGAGMDMGFHTIYTLASVLYRGAVEGDAGYALRQEWL